MPIFSTPAGQVDAPSQEAANLWASKKGGTGAGPSGNTAPAPAEANSSQKLSQVGGDTQGSQGSQGSTGALGALFRGFLHGMGDMVRGGAQIGVRMGQAPQIGQTAPEMPGRVGAIDQAVQQSEQQYQASPGATAHPNASGIGRVGGNVAATAPALAVPGALAATGPTGVLGRLAAAPVIGAAAGMMMPTGPGDSKAKQAAYGAAGGLAGGAAGEALGSTLSSAIAKNTAQGVENYVTNAFRRVVKPGRAGQTSAPQLQAQDQRIITAVDQIIGNKPNLTLTDAAGQQITGQAPRSLRQFSEAIDQTKNALFREYDQMAQAAGQPTRLFGTVGPTVPGIRVDLKPAIAALQQTKASLATQDFHPGLALEADNLAKTLAARGSYSPSEAQDVIQNLNKTLAGYWRNPTRETVSHSALLAPVAKVLRESLDQAITTAQGPGYQALRTRYGALSSVEKDVAAAVQREANKIPGGIGGMFSDIAASEEAIRGVFTLNPAAIARAGTIKAAKAAVKYINDPNRAIQKIFDVRSTPLAGRTRQAIGQGFRQGTGPTGAATGGAAIQAARKVGELKSKTHAANRRGDLSELQTLNKQLAEAIADYRKLRPSA